VSPTQALAVLLRLRREALLPLTSAIDRDATTAPQDMLTDACASCEPYCGGYAHWGMHEAAQWFVQHELSKVVAWAKERDYELLLVGHSLGAGEARAACGRLLASARAAHTSRPAAQSAGRPLCPALRCCRNTGTAAMLAHMMKNEPDAKAAAAGIKFSAVGVATPAVLTEELADGCSDYVTSVVLMVRRATCFLGARACAQSFLDDRRAHTRPSYARAPDTLLTTCSVPSSPSPCAARRRAALQHPQCIQPEG
jgi:hypothetical protein